MEDFKNNIENAMKFSKLNNETIVLICARGGSKGIKDKNLLKIKKIFTKDNYK